MNVRYGLLFHISYQGLSDDTIEELKDYTTPCLCSKPTLITGGVDGAGVDPPSWKMNTFFLRSLALSLPIYRNFQLNGAKFGEVSYFEKNFFI